MWFDNAIGCEKIKFMFNNELSINSVQVIDLIIEGNCNVIFKLKCLDMPDFIPKKWKEKQASAIYLVLKFTDVSNLSIHGLLPGLTLTPSIVSGTQVSEIFIDTGQARLHCTSRWLFIEDLSPYFGD